MPLGICEFLFSGFIHKPGLFQLGYVKIDGGQDGAQQPACRVGHTDRNDLIANLAHYKQICLPEQHKGAEHHNHRYNGVT